MKPAETTHGRTPDEILNTALGQMLVGLLHASHERHAIPPADAARDILDQMTARDIPVSPCCLEWISGHDLRVLIATAVGTHLTHKPKDAVMSRPLPDPDSIERDFTPEELHPDADFLSDSQP